MKRRKTYFIGEGEEIFNLGGVSFRGGDPYTVVETNTAKTIMSPCDYHYIFDKKTGFFARWGKTPKDDPEFSPIGPEILDLEISVNGCPNACKFCYKSNQDVPATNMTLGQFKTLMDKMPMTLTQIAFGITGVQTNPDFIPMLKESRKRGVIPNFTLSGIDLTPKLADEIAPLVGGLAVSVYKTDKNVGYNTVKMFSDRGVKQTNIHLMASQETLDFVYEVLRDSKTDSRLEKLNAIVFLGVKPKGRAKGQFHSLTSEQYADLINYCFENDLRFGFDSCSAPKFEQAVKEREMSEERRKVLLSMSESCESSLFSAYINVKGEYWHCSFSEDEPNVECVNVLECNDFLKDVWFSPAVIKFRQRVLNSMRDGCRHCVTYDLKG